MKLVRKMFLLILVLARTASADPDPVRIGALMVLTGQYAMQGNAFREGIELAIEEINLGGGINGRQLELQAEDTGNLPANALTASRRLLQTDYFRPTV
jgi:branched-chain amino acid transport system substrate-binding protein